MEYYLVTQDIQEGCKDRVLHSLSCWHRPRIEVLVPVGMHATSGLALVKARGKFSSVSPCKYCCR